MKFKSWPNQTEAKSTLSTPSTEEIFFDIHICNHRRGYSFISQILSSYFIKLGQNSCFVWQAGRFWPIIDNIYPGQCQHSCCHPQYDPDLQTVSTHWKTMTWNLHTFEMSECLLYGHKSGTCWHYWSCFCFFLPWLESDQIQLFWTSWFAAVLPTRKGKGAI